MLVDAGSVKPLGPKVVVVGAATIDGGSDFYDHLDHLAAIPEAFVGERLLARGFARDETLEIDHIPNRSDRRAMGQQFAMGVCAASQALNASGLRDLEARARVGIYVATRTAERDEELDRRMHRERLEGSALNAAVMRELRPTMFLAQLPNLLAGNLAIVLGLRGASRTFSGEEMAGVNSIWCAVRDTAAGRVSAALVGGALNARREALLRWLRAGGHARPNVSPRRLADDVARGVIAGSCASFLVLETEPSARSRGATMLASVEVMTRLRAPLQTDPELREAIGDVYDRARETVGDEGLWILTNTQGSAGTPAHLSWLLALTNDPILLGADLSGSALEADASTALARATRLIADPDYFAMFPADAFVRARAGAAPRNVLVLIHGLESGFGAILVRGT